MTITGIANVGEMLTGSYEYVGTSWTEIGTGASDAIATNNSLSIDNSDGTKYVAYFDDQYQKTIVKKWN